MFVPGSFLCKHFDLYPTVKSRVLTIRYEGSVNSTIVDTRNSDTQKEINHAISVRRMLKATA